MERCFFFPNLGLSLFQKAFISPRIQAWEMNGPIIDHQLTTTFAQQITDLLTKQFLYVDERRWDLLLTEIFAQVKVGFLWMLIHIRVPDLYGRTSNGWVVSHHSLPSQTQL